MNHLLPSLLLILALLNGTTSYAKFPCSKKIPPAHFSDDINQLRSNAAYSLPPDTPSICSDTSQRLLFHEDTIAVNANFIARTKDGNFLIPGYYYPNDGIYYNMPYLVKSSVEGNIVWSKRYYSIGDYPSKWFTAGRIKELSNGDLLMTGEIGVPGTDDRRELAVWRLDKNGTLLWATSYESSLWTNPITGSTTITGIAEDASGNIFLSGDIRIFEASKYAFVLKLDSRGNVLWDKNCSSSSAFAFGILLLQDKLLLIGSIGPLLISSSLNTNILWCIQLNTDNGDIVSTKGWYGDYVQELSSNSFADANTSVNMLDDGEISVHGTAYADFQGLNALDRDTINHSIIADFSPDFVFITGIMLSSRQATNYYNTVATQHANGRISYSRFLKNNNLYNEDIIYGSVQNNQVIKERIYKEQNRSSRSISNFLFYSPDEDVVIQTYRNQAIAKGGLEIIRLRDSDSSSLCNAKNTSLTFIQPYFMKEVQVRFDSIVVNAFQQTYHNSVTVNEGNIFKSTGCTLAEVHVYPIPVVSLDKNSVLCIGNSRELSAGQGYSQYVWNNQSTGPSIFVSDTGKYWVSVTDQNGCKGSDTTYITTIAPIPSDFLPHDTTVCEFAKLTIFPVHTYQTYLWNDQSTGPSLTVSQPGLYRLLVTDSNHCAGSDSLLLTQKQCLEGLFVPNAFTPNNDGRNDVFRPLLFGNITRFRFAVYNRWGEKVFETYTPGRGWDGKQNGIPVADGAFVWYCQYQLDGQPDRTRKGTVLLIH